MPFSSGTFTLVAGNPVTTGTTISSTWANNTLSDIASALSTCVLKDGTQTITANLPMSNFKITGLGAGSAAGDSLRYEQLFTTGNLVLLGGLDTVQAATITATATIAIGTMAGNYAVVTGTATVSSFGSGAAGLLRILEWSGVTPLNNNSNLILPGGANLTTATGDLSIAISDGSAVWRIIHQRSSGGVIASATQAQQETGTSATMPVTPSVQQFHPSSAKAWCMFNGTTVGTNAPTVGLNVTSVQRTGAGVYVVSFTTAFSSANYVVSGAVLSSGGGNTVGIVNTTSVATGSATVNTIGTNMGLATQASTDFTAVYLVFFGDQ